MNETDLKKEIWSYFQKMQLIFLATCEGEQPRVRPVTLIHFNDKFWISTGTNSAKMKQIRENNNIALCVPLKEGENGGYIRGQGKAIIVQNKDVKKLLADNIPFFKQFWKDPNDPNYTLLEIVMKEIDYLKPGAFKVEKLSL
ncbi:hypothetical protein AMJ52_07655 [candidate division TA06 bacterium DG_78]|uniref:Pyridoxamine 5'-phosphate oxidase N-terminal domain-containing protein n=1 Tax=candidate division TA06 bacterium DG_78 TaxID=1703772 RepID=A0A0S7YD91_UNCT6|nr:MAG: hypothetical protein AMJ52_07655 [candidate division TA06 bacterium DG_78]